MRPSSASVAPVVGLGERAQHAAIGAVGASARVASRSSTRRRRAGATPPGSARRHQPKPSVVPTPGRRRAGTESAGRHRDWRDLRRDAVGLDARDPSTATPAAAVGRGWRRRRGGEAGEAGDGDSGTSGSGRRRPVHRLRRSTFGRRVMRPLVPASRSATRHAGRRIRQQGHAPRAAGRAAGHRPGRSCAPNARRAVLVPATAVRRPRPHRSSSHSTSRSWTCFARRHAHRPLHRRQPGHVRRIRASPRRAGDAHGQRARRQLVTRRSSRAASPARRRIRAASSGHSTEPASRPTIESCMDQR